jgi:uncharacterized surface protein with fasciclin (FAS1) repeats
MNTSAKWIASGLVFSALMAGCATPKAPVNVAQTIAGRPELSTLNQLLAKAGLEQTLAGAGPFTVFAPTNDAFKAVPAKTMDELGRDPTRLKSLLLHHVLPTKAMAIEVKQGNVKTANGSDLALARAGTYVIAEDATVQSADIVAANGVVHTIDRVLSPPAPR